MKDCNRGVRPNIGSFCMVKYQVLYGCDRTIVKISRTPLIQGPSMLMYTVMLHTILAMYSSSAPFLELIARTASECVVETRDHAASAHQLTLRGAAEVACKASCHELCSGLKARG